ncbi:MAG: glutamine synthetase family protein [Paracoccaceae bacterium]|nr:glutamine synthetase family protein [Paracoccaceae bacterium]
MTTHRIRTLFCDLHGLSRGKFVSPEFAERGQVGFARPVFAVSLDREIIAVPGAGVETGLPDMELMLDGTLRKDWRDGTEIALGDLHADGAPYELCARGALRRAIAGYEDAGLRPMVGIEFEAYAYQRDDDGVWRPYDTPGAFVYGTGPANDPRGLMDALWDAALTAGIPIESLNGEYDSGQFELTLGFGEALTACDDAFLFRTMAKEIAAGLGLLLTFMPKPIPDRGGSGLHVNFSFRDADGANVIPDTSGELSDLARNCVAGLMHHHESLSGLLATTVNSYDRLAPASMAGYWANWAHDHRLVTVRTATGSPASARLEHRMADAAANPYLAVAAVLQAARLGIDNGYPLPPAEDLDGIENTRATRHVPSSLPRALDALGGDLPLRQRVGELLCDALIETKRDEAKRLSGKSVDEVRDFYLPFI